MEARTLGLGTIRQRRPSQCSISVSRHKHVRPGEPVADGPGIGVGVNAHRLQDGVVAVTSRGWIRRRHDAPAAAVPALGECLAVLVLTTPPFAYQPRVTGAVGGGAPEDVALNPCRGDSVPASAVPTFEQMVADRPRVV